jgi:hypothetical protein
MEDNLGLGENNIGCIGGGDKTDKRSIIKYLSGGSPPSVFGKVAILWSDPVPFLKWPVFPVTALSWF